MAPGESRKPFSCLKVAGAGGFEPPTTGFGDQRGSSRIVFSCLPTSFADSAGGNYLCLETLIVPDDPSEIVGKMSAIDADRFSSLAWD